MTAAEREIEALVSRFLGPALLLAGAAGCDVIYDSNGRQLGAHAPDADSGAVSELQVAQIPDLLDTFEPPLPAAGSGFETAHCRDGHWDPMPYVQPAVPSDYHALQQVIDRTSLSTLSEAGVLCATASDPSQCRSAASTLPLQSSGFPYILTTTYGDAVQQFRSTDVKAFLGENHTVENALLLLLFSGYQPGHGGNPCADATVRDRGDFFEVYAIDSMDDCRGGPPITTRYLFQVSPKFRNITYVTSVHERMSTPGGCPGRRPSGLRTPLVAANSVCGHFFAHCAQLEAAAVFAFARMHAELHAHVAPGTLLRAALSAQADERRHARQMQRVAAAHGAAALPIQVAPFQPRTLVEMAIENAAEGCARERWAAVVATHQAARSADAQLRAIMNRIARDERRHVALSLQVAHWLDTRLSIHERRLVRSAYADTMADLRREVSRAADPELIRVAGLPSPAAAAALLGELEHSQVAQAWL